MKVVRSFSWSIEVWGFESEWKEPANRQSLRSLGDRSVREWGVTWVRRWNLPGGRPRLPRIREA